MKALEDENAKLKKLFAEQKLDVAALREPLPKMVRPAAQRELTTLIERRGKPEMTVSDNGTELTSNAILAWAKDHKIE